MVSESASYSGTRAAKGWMQMVNICRKRSEETRGGPWEGSSLDEVKRLPKSCLAVMLAHILQVNAILPVGAFCKIAGTLNRKL